MENMRDPTIAIGSGPAQQWRFRFPALGEPRECGTPRSPYKTPDGSISEEIRLAFARFDTDGSGDIDVAELEKALVHLGIEGLPSGRFNEDAASIIARYDPEGKGLGSGTLRLAEFNALCLDALEVRCRTSTSCCYCGIRVVVLQHLLML